MSSLGPHQIPDEVRKAHVVVSITDVDTTTKSSSVSSTSIKTEELHRGLFEAQEEPKDEISTWRATVVVLELAGIGMAVSMSTGVYTIVLPVLEKDLHLGNRYILCYITGPYG
jgi:hypothetical protein